MNAADFNDHKVLTEHIQSCEDRCRNMGELLNHSDEGQRSQFDKDEYEHCYLVAEWLKELVNRRNMASRDAELLASTKAMCSRQKAEIDASKHKLNALGEIMADLKLDLNARE